MEIVLDFESFPNSLIIHLIFKNKKLMNLALGRISYLRESNKQVNKQKKQKNYNYSDDLDENIPKFNYIGHNFPLNYLLKYFNNEELNENEIILQELLQQTLQQILNERLNSYKTLKSYVIGYVKNDTITLDHELKHCKYYCDPEYKDFVKKLWNSLPEKKREEISLTLDDMGYREKFHIDEFQAYLFSEPLKSSETEENFWKI